MALREIRKIGDDILRKKSRVVEKIDDRVKQLLEDMEDTMYNAKGVGLAAPQVGVLKTRHINCVRDHVGRGAY
jgi:peptide deformylase